MTEFNWTQGLNLLVLLGIAILQWHNTKAMVEVRKDVRKVELATNSLQDKMIAAKDAEVLATGREQHAAGLAAGRAEQRAERKADDAERNTR